MSVSAAAAAYRYVRNPGGGYSGPWRNETVPYMREPMDQCASREVRAVIFVGPSQSAKTDGLVINTVVHAVAVDPADMLIVQMSEKAARDFSRRRLSRMNRDCDAVRERVREDWTFEKVYLGMMLAIGHPTITELSSRPIPRVIFTDYDRMPDDVEGEGEPFALGEARIKTFGSRGVVVAESSPGRPITDGDWKASSPHEAPPTGGILALYNRGDRRRWVWPCPQCDEYFEGEFEHLAWPDHDDDGAAAAETTMICPANGCVIEPHSKTAMNAAGLWIAEGQTVEGGIVRGEKRRTVTASYWLKGPAAAFQTWPQLVEKYLTAKRDFDSTGDEAALKTTTNTDQGVPYLSQFARYENPFEVEAMLERLEDFPLAVVPAGARFLTASVDVQNNRFEVLVRAWGPELESWPLERFALYEAEDREGLIAPDQRAEDWLLIDQVVNRTYPVAGHDGRQMHIARTVIDSGFATEHAYRYWRLCRKRGLHRRVALSKGDSRKAAARIKWTFPDTSGRKDRKALGRGEVPVCLFNVNALKDTLSRQVARDEPGGDYVHFSKELAEGEGPHAFFEELTAERRQPNGQWKRHKQRNETLDLMVMAHVGALQLKGEVIDWTAPPLWAAPIKENSLVTDLGHELPTAAKAPQRRAARRVLSKGVG